MRIRRSRMQVDLRSLPLDGLDMFVLTRVDDHAALSLVELSALVPCDATTTAERVEHLEQLGVLEVQHIAAPRAAVDGLRSVAVAFDDATTLRPPKAHLDDAQTLRPPQPAPRHALAQPWLRAKRHH